jgi:hypothetical protein
MGLVFGMVGMWGVTTSLLLRVVYRISRVRASSFMLGDFLARRVGGVVLGGLMRSLDWRDRLRLMLVGWWGYFGRYGGFCVVMGRFG